MNRRERRVAASKSKRKPIDRIIAVHEAGHAVAKYLTADDMGLSQDNCITYIDLGDGSVELSQDKTMILTTQATTYGPKFSADINAVVMRETAGKPTGTIQEYIQLVAMAAGEGANIEKWVKSRALDAVFGPMAEFRFTGRVVPLTAYEYRSDLEQLVHDCTIAGLDSELDDVIRGAIDRGAQLLQRPEVGAAIDALAKELQAMGVGRMGV